jgi:hypothetical protein
LLKSDLTSFGGKALKMADMHFLAGIYHLCAAISVDLRRRGNPGVGESHID